MDTSIAESLKLMVTALLIAMFLNVAGIIYHINQANTFEKQAVQIMQKDGGLTPDAMQEIDNRHNGLSKQYGYMFDIESNDPTKNTKDDPTKNTKDTTVASDTSAYFVPKTDSNNIATDVFADIDHPNQLFKKDGDIDKSTIYAPAPTPPSTVSYKRELNNSDYQHYLSLVHNEDYNEALKFLHSKGIDADDNMFYTIQEGESVEPKNDIIVPVYVAYNSAVDSQGNTGHKLTYKPVYIYDKKDVPVKINGKTKKIDIKQEVVDINGKLKTIRGNEVTDATGKKVEVVYKNGELKTIDGDKVPPKNETYSVISTYNDKPIMINSDLLLTNTDIHPYDTKIHYWVIMKIPYIAFSKFKPGSDAGVVIKKSYMGETVSKYGLQAKNENASKYGIHEKQ